MGEAISGLAAAVLTVLGLISAAVAGSFIEEGRDSVGRNTFFVGAALVALGFAVGMNAHA